MRQCVLSVGTLVLLAIPAFSGVTVSTPSSGSTVAAPVHFAAGATSTCAKGVASMGIYAAPGVLSYVVSGAKLDTNLNLGPGAYNTVVQAWDYCGGASTTPVTITVVNSNVQVSLPASGATSSSPVHFVASATSSCGQGVAAMGIYPAPNQLAYVANGSSLDTSLNLSPGTYNAVVEEWDRCGAASTKTVTVIVGNGGAGNPGVQVSAPANNSTVSAPVHYAATAGTTCSKGVSAVGVYVNNNLATVSSGANLDANLNLSPGNYSTVVQGWDLCGGVAKTPVSINVSGAAGKTFYALQKSAGWTGYGELPPVWDICSACSPAVIWSMTQGIASPSVSGSAMATYVAGQTPYSNALWNNHLIGDFSSQGLPDPNQTLSSTLHNFTYEVSFFGANLEASQALEFDINQFVGGKSFIWGNECRVASGHQWDVWNNAANAWVPTGIACNPASNSWNHLVIQVQRTSDNRLLYQSITLNGQPGTLNKYDNPTASSWNGITINYQLDGNIKQQSYTVLLDNLNFTYY
jgi:hypothetical protein